MATSTDALNRVTRWAYDAVNRLTQVTDPAGGVTRYSYDGNGNLLTVTDAKGQVTTFAYDAMSRLASTTDPLGRTETYTYDGADNLISRVTPKGETITFTYDAANQVLTKTLPDNHITRYTYATAPGEITLLSQGKPATASGTYSTATPAMAFDGSPSTGWNSGGYAPQWIAVDLGAISSLSEVRVLAGVGLPAGTTGYEIQVSTDAAAWTTAASASNGSNTTFTATAVSASARYVRIYVTSHSGSSWIALAEVQVYGQTLPSNVGNLTGVTDPDSALTMTYDLANRLTTVSTAGSPNQPAVTVRYTYDKNGNRLTLGDPTGTDTYRYDALNRLTSVTSPSGAATYAFDALSRRTSVTLPNGTQTTYTYDPASQVTNILHKITATSATINKADYVYNPVGNRTSLTDKRGAQAFGYDTLDRVTSASHPLLVTPQSFAYDPVGNRTTTGSLYNVGNQLTEDANFTYTYDLNGNLTRKTFKVSGNHIDYTYDAENRLIKVEEFAAGATTPGATSTYRYDGFGRRIEKIGNGITRRYVYDGEDILLEYDGANVLQARYTHGPGIDEPMAMTRGGNHYFYHHDGLGTITDLTDTTGAVVKSYAYDAWGNIIDQTGAVENPYTYTAREYDPETGMYYYRARYYDPKIGRFITSDPIGLAGGLNTYAYVDNNPLRWTDPYGLSKFDKLFGLPKQFWNWYHKKVKRPGDPDLTKEEARELHEEWKDLGKPKPDNKGNQGGFVDPVLLLLEWLIPWPLIPSELGAPPCEMPGGPPCGPTEPQKPENCK